MASINFNNHTQFFTATILEWKHLLKKDEYKQIIIESLLFLKKEGSVVINAFVIMPNHIHLIWGYRTIINPIKYKCGFKIYSAQMKFRLLDTNDAMLNNFLVNSKDRQYQFWERNSLNVDLWNGRKFSYKS